MSSELIKNETRDDDNKQQEHQEEQEEIEKSAEDFSIDLKYPLGLLKGDHFEYYINKKRIIVGRKSKLSHLLCDVIIENSTVVSRQHFALELDPKCTNFCLMCLGKNGLFVNNDYIKPGILHFLNNHIQSIFRFPNTQIRLLFESYLSRSSKSKDLNDNFVYIKTTSPSLPNLNEPNSDSSQNNQCRQQQQQQQHEVIDLGLIDTSDDAGDKPLYTYAQLIAQAILSSKEKQLTLNQIYAYIANRFPFYQINDKGWQNSIRHNLSLNRFFIKIPRQHNEPGKGSFWRIHKDYQDSLSQQAFVHKRSRFFNCNNYSRSKTSTSGDSLKVTSLNENENSSESPINSSCTSTNNNNEQEHSLNSVVNKSNENKIQNSEQMLFNPEMLITYLCKNVNNKNGNKNSRQESSSNKDSSNSDFTSNKSHSNESSNDNQGSSSNNGNGDTTSTSSSSFANIFFAKLLKSVASGKFKSEEYSDNQTSLSNKSTPSPPQSSSQQGTSQTSSSPKQDDNPNSNSSSNNSGSEDIESKKRKLSGNSSET